MKVEVDMLLQIEAMDRVLARVTGPMHARLVIQPLIAICLGIRDGIADSKAGAPPFLWDLIVRPDGRGTRLKGAFHRVMVPFCVAVVLDLIVQFLIFERVRLLGAVVVGISLMGIPYSVARSLSNRVASSKISKDGVPESAGT